MRHRKMSTAIGLAALVFLLATCLPAHVFAAAPAGAPPKLAVPAQDSEWYLAEGSTNWGFDCYIMIENPTKFDVHARVTFMTSTGPITLPDITLPTASQTALSPVDLIGPYDFSTKVVCVEGYPIAVDREMFWTGPGASTEGAHGSIGVTAPATTWYLPEGSSKWGFECWLLIQNPNATVAHCNVTYMIEGGTPVVVPKEVPANSRQSYFMADDIGSNDASIKVSSNLPVIPERAMYRNNRREGHDSIGTTTPATDFYLAEGTTDYGFTTYVLVQNPGTKAAQVKITYMTSGGPLAQPTFTMPPASRKTVRVNDALLKRDMSTNVHANVPIIAERAMYWNNGTGEAMHDSIGLAGPHDYFFLPDGRTDAGFETWTLVQNPNTTPVDISVNYYPLGGGPVKGFDATIDAQSRVSYDMFDTLGPDHYASVGVYTTTPGKKIMVERAIYGQNRGSGTDTIGGYLDEAPAMGLLSRPAADGSGYRPAQVADTRPPKPW